MITTRNTLGTGSLGGGRAIAFACILTIAALALLARSGHAQEIDRTPFDLFGTVVDATSGEALVGAWVGYTDSNWGSITDDVGRFRFPDMVPGRLALTIEQLGYEALEWVGAVSAADELLRIELTPQPIILEGLNVVVDRFESRRRAVATSVFAYDAADLQVGTAQTAMEFVRNRVNSSFVPCSGAFGGTCIRVRGQAREPSVYVDEMPVLGGLDYLDTFAPWELYMIEIYGRGRHIRAYTHQFMERAAKIRLHPLPFIL
jgi:hypothetical protein